MTRLLRWLDRLPNWLRSSIMTSWFTFIGTFGIAVAGWLTSVADWANGNAAFPSLRLLAMTAVAALAGAAGGVVNAAVRWSQERRGTGNPPVYPTRPSVASTSGSGGSASTTFLDFTGTLDSDGTSWDWWDGKGNRLPDDRGQVTAGTAILILVAVLLVIIVLRGTGTC